MNKEKVQKHIIFLSTMVMRDPQFAKLSSDIAYYAERQNNSRLYGCVWVWSRFFFRVKPRFTLQRWMRALQRESGC